MLADRSHSSNSRPRNPRPWSSHGEARRNSGNFTRGSQLIGHQYAMWWRGARIPLIVWCGLVAVLLWARLHMILGEYETRMIGMRVLATFWGYIGLAEGKSVNIVLRDGSTLKTLMPLVAQVPDVQVAWGKLTSTLAGALLFASGIALPASIWFIRWARDRGETILADHHERGVELALRADLLAILERHNAKAMLGRAREAFPGLSHDQVLARPLAARKSLGLVAPYQLGTLPFPMGHEQSHVMVIGTTGSGKTTALRDLVRQAVERGDSAVIFDLTGHYVEAFYQEGRDHILNLNDARCETWSIFNDCDTQSEFVAAATALIPPERGSDGGFWEKAARMLFVEMCVKLKAQGLGSNRALSDELMKASLSRIHARMKGTVADPLTSPDVARMAQSIRAVLNANGEALRFLPENGEAFSIRDWLRRDDKGGSILFITAQYVHLDMSRSLLTLWMNIAINTLMTLRHTRMLRCWFFFDELGALHQLPALTRGLQTARSFGGAFVLGVHSFAGLREVYGENGARNIISLTGTKLILRTSDRDTAEECSKLIGFRKVRTMDEAYSYGAHQTRDASTISPTSREEALVIADDITSLMNLSGYIRFPERFPAAHVTMSYRDYPAIAEGFIDAPPLPLAEPPTPATEGDDDSGAEEAGGREGAEEQAGSSAQRAAAGKIDEARLLADIESSESRDEHGEAVSVSQVLREQRGGEPREEQQGEQSAQQRNVRRSTLGGARSDAGQAGANLEPGGKDAAGSVHRHALPLPRQAQAEQAAEERETSLKLVRGELQQDFARDEPRRSGGEDKLPSGSGPAIDDDHEIDI